MTRRRVRGLKAGLVALALVAAACSSATTLDQPETAAAAVGTDPAAAATPAPTEVPPTAIPTVAPATPTPPSTPPPVEPVRERFAGLAPSDVVAPPDWGDVLPVHPGTIETTLDNGLRVIVRRNTAPGRQAHLRLVVEAGSIDEDPAFLGSAHFLEHMMFNGTAEFPGNELVPVLESFGAGFGPDVNAYTSYGETVYQLTVPAGSPDAIELGLEVLVEWSDRATIEPAAVVAERGVVREEYRRGRETVGGRLGAAMRDALLADSIYRGREPIGTIDSIEQMSAAELRIFYERWYRPDRMAVVAVGDFEPATMVRLVESAFGSLTVPDDEAPVRPADDAARGLSEPVFDVYTDPELSRSEVSVRWRTDTLATTTTNDLRATLARELAVRLIDRRLFERVERGISPATSQGAGRQYLTPSHGLVVLSGRAAPGDLTEVLAGLLTAAEQARQHRFSEVGFAQGIAELRAGIEQARAEADRRQDSAIAASYTRYVLGEGIEADPDIELEQTLSALDSLRPLDVQLVIDELLDTAPYVLVTGPVSQAADLPEPEVLAAVHDDIVGWVVDPPAVAEEAPRVLLEAPTAATIVADEFDSELSTRVVTFENGVRLAVRETRIVDNRIQFQAWSRGGHFLETAELAPLLGWTSSIVVGSGFESVDPVDLDRLLGDRLVELTADVSRAVELLSGGSATRDLETLLQLVHLQMTEPTTTDVAVRRFEETWRPIAENPEIRPELAGDLVLWRLRYGDSPWFRRIPSIADLDALDVEAQLNAWRGRFANAADFVFVVVGDLDPDAVVELGARYLGTLPAAEVREQAIDRDPGLPESNLVETVEAGVGDRARLRINWESPYPFTLEAAVTAQVLEVVVNARLRDVVREQLGASYSPRASVSVLVEPKSWVDTIIEVETDPERIVEVSDVVHDELAAIRAGELDPGYLERAVDQLVERYRFVTNAEWIDRITFHLVHPDRPSGEYRQRSDIAQRLTMGDLAATAQIVFPETRSVEVRLVPGR